MGAPPVARQSQFHGDPLIRRGVHPGARQALEHLMSLPAYQPNSDLLPLDDAELEQLDELLAGLPDGALNIEALDGFLSALLLSPVPLASLPGEAWLPEIWGQQAGEPEPFASGKQRKKLQLLVLRHLRALDAQLGTSAWEPLFSLAEQDGQEWVDAEDWCTGFMIAVDLAGEAWTARFDSGETAAWLAPIALLGGDEAQQDPEALAELADPAVRDALSREVHAGVQALRAFIAA